MCPEHLAALTATIAVVNTARVWLTALRIRGLKQGK